MAMKRKKTIVYQVKVIGKPGHGLRTPIYDDALRAQRILEKLYPKVKIIKNWV